MEPSADPVSLTETLVKALGAADVETALSLVAEDAVFDVEGFGSWTKEQLADAAGLLAGTEDLTLVARDIVAKRNVALCNWSLVLPPFFRFAGVGSFTWNRAGLLAHASIKVQGQ